MVDAIIGSAKTGQIGDGKIFVTTIDQAVRIRTGETDVDALVSDSDMAGLRETIETSHECSQ